MPTPISGTAVANAATQLRIVDLDQVLDSNISTSMNFAIDFANQTFRMTGLQFSTWLTENMDFSAIDVSFDNTVFVGAFPVEPNPPTTVQAAIDFGYPILAEVSLKADITYVDSANAAQDSVIALKADIVYVDSENIAQDSVIALKADITYVDSGLSGKATTAQGALADSATQPSDPVSSLTNDAGYITSATNPAFTTGTTATGGWTKQGGIYTEWGEFTFPSNVNTPIPFANTLLNTNYSITMQIIASSASHPVASVSSMSTTSFTAAPNGSNYKFRWSIIGFY